MPGGQVIILPDGDMSGAPHWVLVFYVIVTFGGAFGSLILCALVFFDCEGGAFEEWIVDHLKLILYALVPLAFFGMMAALVWRVG